MRESNIYSLTSLLLLICLLLYNEPGVEGWRRRRRRNPPPPPPPPRCYCTPSTPNVNTNPYGLAQGGAHVCTRNENLQETYCTACTCGQCTHTRMKTFVHLFCCPGYQKSGNTCPIVIPCNQPGYITNGDFSPINTNYAVGQTVKYTCRTNYQITSGNSVLTCQVGPRWNVNPPTCGPIPCKEPNLPPNSNIQGGRRGNYAVSSSITIQCNSGYAKTGGGSTLSCGLGNTWTGLAIQCTPVCWGNIGACPKGGKCVSPNNCVTCDDGYYSPKCDPCPKIINCQLSVCDSSDIYKTLRCKKCMYDYGANQGKAYEVSPDGTSCLMRCSWRDDSNVCYPGTCGLLDTCQCGQGFKSKDTQCDTITQKPRISPGFIRFYYGGDLSGQQNLVNITEVVQSGDIVYSKAKNVEKIDIEISGNFIIDYPERPPYVTKVSVGLQIFEMIINLKRSENNEIRIFTDKPTLDLNNLQTMHEVKQTQSFNQCSGKPCLINHRDVLEVRAYLKNGGYINIKNFETNSIKRRDFSGLDHSRTVKVIYDQEKPVHCSKLSSCSEQALDLKQDIIRNDVAITAYWQGWTDSDSGIKNFEIEIVQLTRAGDQLIEGHSSPNMFHKTIPIDSASVTDIKIEYPTDRSAVYSIKLSVCDSVMERIPNCEHTRRFLLVDSGTAVDLDTQSMMRLIGSVTDETSNRVWINSVTSDVTLDWTGRFINRVHYTQGLLLGIKPWPYHGEDKFYDDLTGQRNINAIPNVLGIVRFEAQFMKDKDGGKSLTSPDNTKWISMGRLNPQMHIFSVSPEDGESIKLWIKAEDVIGHTNVDTLLFHYDSSPPILEDISLTKDNQIVKVHHVKELYELNIQWQSFDQHSGIFKLSWRLFDNFTRESILIGSENLGHQGNYKSLAECHTAHSDTKQFCYCTPVVGCFNKFFKISPTKDSTLLPNKHLSEHDYDLFFEVTVTNHARLVTTKSIKISIDTTAPIPGTVHDGLPGNPEVDYQSSLDISGYWMGFIDPESGIRLYKYKFGTVCSLQSDFTLSNKKDETLSTSVKWRAPGPGKYFLTVVAYNDALEPSAPLCSSGVVIDNSAPVLRSISVQELVTRPSLIRSKDQQTVSDGVWYVNEHRKKQLVTNITARCFNKAKVIDDIDLIPEIPQMKWMLTDEECDQLQEWNPIALIVKEKPIIVDFIGYDNESHIADFKISLEALTVVESFSEILYSTFTNSQNHFKINDANIKHGSQFMLAVEAFNKAGLSTKRRMGPIIVDSTGPVQFSNPIKSIIEKDRQVLNNVVISWSDPWFGEDEDPYKMDYSFSLGSSPLHSDLQSFSPLKFDTDCPQSIPPKCLSLDLSNIHLHPSMSIYVTLRAKNTVGLHTTTTIAHITFQPEFFKAGMIAVVKSLQNPVVTHFQTDGSTLYLQWKGFSIGGNNRMAVDIGVTDSSTDPNYKRFYLDQTEGVLLLDNLNLKYYTKYVVELRVVDTKETILSQNLAVIPQNAKYEVNITVGDPNCYEAGPTGLSVIPTVKEMNFCPSEEGFQSSSSSFQTSWTIPAYLTDFVTQTAVSLVDNGVANGKETILEEKLFMGAAGDYRFTQLSLPVGHSCAVDIQFYFGEIVSGTHRSKSLVISSSPPVRGKFQAKFSANNEILYNLDQFQVPEISNDNVGDSIHHYEWNVALENGVKPLYKWTMLRNYKLERKIISGSITLENNLTFTNNCPYLFIRGVSMSGIETTISTQLSNCQDEGYLSTDIVIDATSPVDLRRNAPWTEHDIDFTNSSNSLSAVWPTLRHGKYGWAVLRDDAQYKSSQPIKSLQLSKPCDHPLAVKCGSVEEAEFVNIEIDLVAGSRYHICVHANDTIKVYEKYRTMLPAVSACSDGVTVIHHSPRSGIVELRGDSTSTKYSTSLDKLMIKFSGFEDPDYEMMNLKGTGIAKYFYMIGSSPGGQDIQKTELTGMKTELFLQNVKLKNNGRYYATIVAENHVGLKISRSSQSLLIDIQSPFITNRNGVLVENGAHYLKKKDSVLLSWRNVFDDKESGLKEFSWCIGTSQEDNCDVIGDQLTNQEYIIQELSSLVDGIDYYLHVQAFDRVGHVSSSVSSNRFRIMSSAPHEGTVSFLPINDTTESGQVIYQTHRDSLTVYWENFIEPHADNVTYEVMLGTCARCEDVMRAVVVHQKETSLRMTHLDLQTRIQYYATVRACNQARVCSNAVSKPLVIDLTPPIMGVILDGYSIEDQDFISQRNFVSASLFGFSDPESSISLLTWCISSNGEMCDIVSESEREPFIQTLRKKLDKPLPIDTHLKIIIRVYNYAGLFIRASSNGFVIDENPPEFTQDISFDLLQGSFNPSTQVYSTRLKVTWELADNLNYIVDQYLTVNSHSGSHHVADTIKMSGVTRQYTLSNLNLRDGYRYFAALHSCNAAKVCATSQTGEILVDGSPPHVGMFAVSTEHIIQLHTKNMTWTDRSIQLTCSNFIDPHSGIANYRVSIGSTYMNNDLAENTNLTPQNNADIQEWLVDLKKTLTVNTKIYVTLQARNKVGALSHILHSAFIAQSDGLLSLVRRCEAQTCLGDCECAPLHQRCKPTGKCVDKSESASPSDNFQVIDTSRLNQLSDSNFSIKDESHMTEKCSLAATWRNANLDQFIRFEVSAGLANENEPRGLFDHLNERIWFEVGKDNHAVLYFKGSSGNCMENLIQYKFFVRAWLDPNTYIVRVSNGVDILSTVPRVQYSMGAIVKDILPSSSDNRDVDFVSVNQTSIIVDFKNKFASQLVKYCVVTLSNIRAGSAIVSSSQLPSSVSRATLSNLQLQDGRHYFSTVQCCNVMDLCATASSDGFTADSTPPEVGVIFDSGKPYEEVLYQNHSSSVSAYWSGFWDKESYIREYYWCVGRSGQNGEECSLHGWVNMKYGQSGTLPINTDTQIIYNKVYAVNGAGLKSKVAISRGIIVDRTGPVLSPVNGKSNLIDVHLRTGVKSSEIRVRWSPSDQESGISDNLIALGTVPGGIQILPYQSLGPDTYSFESGSISLPQGTPIYVSIVVTNRAGLSTFHQAEEITRVDYFPPQLSITVLNSDDSSCNQTESICVLKKDEDLRLQLEATALITSLKSCSLTIGSQLHLNDLFDSGLIQVSNKSQTTRYLFEKKFSNLRHGMWIYPCLFCQNMNNQQSVKCVDEGILVSIKAPSIIASWLRIVNPSETYYPMERPLITNYQSLDLVWESFEDESMIESYEFALMNNNEKSIWKTLSTKEFTRSARIDIMKSALIPEKSHTILVRARNVGGYISEPIKIDFYPTNQRPELSGSNLTVTWSSPNELKSNLTLEWRNVFNYPPNERFYYEITVGTADSKGDVLLAVSTLKSSIKLFKMDRVNVNYFVKIRCVATSGLFTTGKFSF